MSNRRHGSRRFQPGILPRWNGRGRKGLGYVANEHSSRVCVGSLADASDPVGQRLKKGTKKTVWQEMGKYIKSIPDLVNLGQGYPDWDPPKFVQESASEAIALGHNQYTRTEGHADLVRTLASRYSAHLNRTVDPMTEIAVTVGCSQALFLTLTALIQPGDEVLLIEPFFDLYLGQVKLAGGKPVSVPLDLRDGNWEFDIKKLEAAISPRTRAIILNTPHNPTGKVFTLEEMEQLAGVVRRNPQISVISDEVYKYVIDADEEELQMSTVISGDISSKPAPPPRHIHFAALDGMWDRTVTCSSAGKTFSITGWQVGWLVAPKEFVSRVHALLPYVQFCVASPMQHALSTVLDVADRPFEGYNSYYGWLRAMYARKRQLLLKGLSEAGLVPTSGEGGFFVMADASRLLPMVPDSYLSEAKENDRANDFALCKWLAESHGILCIPGSPFFSDQEQEETRCLVRLAFCKRDEILEKAVTRFKILGQDLKAFEESLESKEVSAVGASSPSFAPHQL